MAENTGISPAIFRAYDIRGIVGEGLDPHAMTLIGHAIGSEALDRGLTSLVAAADARHSSPSLSAALIEGILATGCDVCDIGTVPTPVLYFATHDLDSTSGVMVTGSHNPGNYNGVKIVLNRECLAENQIMQLYHRISEQRFHKGIGKLSQENIVPRYLSRISSDLNLSRPWHVVVDAGNGVTGSIAPALFESLGCRVTPLYCELDGDFPHHHPDPTREQNLRDLKQTVKDLGADLGIAFDGDGDRVGLVTASGRTIDADKLLMVFLRDLLPDNPGARIVYDVKSSWHLKRLIETHGGVPVMCKSGHSFVKRKLKETGALLGGEYSAHIFFNHRWYGFDDGLYVAARFLELLDKYGESADQLLSALPESVSTPEIFIPVPEQDKFRLVAEFQRQCRMPDAHIDTLDGVRADFDHGWGLLRASNTIPSLVMRFEAIDSESLQRIQSRFREVLKTVAPSLSVSI